MRFCPSCGTRLPEGARFCEHCGAAVGAPVAGAPVPPVVPVPQPVHQPVGPPTGYALQPLDGAVPPGWSPEQAAAGPGTARKNRRGLMTALGGVAAVGVLGAVGYVVYDQFTGPNGGADSPSAAVLELAAAAEGEDAVTALSLLPPGEVGPLVELYQDVEAKATSTGVAAEDNPFAGFDVDLDGVAVRTEELGPDVAAVTITSGTVSWTLDPDKLQGPLRIQDTGELRRPSEGSADLVEVTRDATDGAPVRLMTVQRDGTWYVSPMYTLLELWRVQQALPAPDFSTEIDLAGTGAESATAAVEQAAQALARYDVDGFLDLLSPDEAAALYHYRDAIVMSLHQDGDLAEVQSETRLTVDSLNASEGDEVDDRVPVTVRSASGSLADDNGNYFSWTLDRNCISYAENGDSDGACLDEAFRNEGISSRIAAEFPALTLLTQEVDGRWYLSPLATLVADARHVVAKLDADDVAALLRVPQFGGVDGQLEEGKTLDGSVEQAYDYALYEMDVPAGTVFSACVDDAAGWGIYGPDGRPASSQAVLAEDAGRYRVLVVGGESTAFRISPALSSVEEVTVPSTVPAAGDGACGSRLVSFDATVGQPLLLGTEDDSAVEVVAPNGDSVWTTVFQPTETGRHVLVVPADQAVGIEALPADVLTAGGSVTGTVAGSQPTTMRVFVGAGEEVEIQVEGEGSMDPYVELNTLDGYTVSSDSAGYFYSTATVFPYFESTAQIYELSVQDYSGETGSFRVTVLAH